MIKIDERIIIETDGEIDITIPKDFEECDNRFDIYLHNTDENVGRIWFDENENFESDRVKYYGNVGYWIKKEYQGHKYALKALYLIKKVMLEDDVKTMLFSILPKNKPSRTTVERFGAHILCHRNIPVSHELYEEGKERIIYKYDIEGETDETNKNEKHL